MGLTNRGVTALFVLVALPAMLSLSLNAAEKPLLSSRPGTLTFSKPERFGQRLLAAGSYEFRCVHKGAHHLMMLHRILEDSSGRVISLGQPVATDYCRMEALPEPVKTSSARITQHVSGTAALEEVRIAGERVRHILGEVLGFDRAAYL
jgi:hypothetical protein